MLLTSESGFITGIHFDNQKYFPELNLVEPTEHRDIDVLSDAVCQLGGYFAGTRREFSLPLKPAGTEFQRAVWEALCGIPFGKRCTYMDIAELIGSPKGVRAVGGAIGRNPISIVIPCHRVIGSNGSLTGFASGIEKKKKLLAIETSELQLPLLFENTPFENALS